MCLILKDIRQIKYQLKKKKRKFALGQIRDKRKVPKKLTSAVRILIKVN